MTKPEIRNEGETAKAFNAENARLGGLRARPTGRWTQRKMVTVERRNGTALTAKGAKNAKVDLGKDKRHRAKPPKERRGGRE